MCIVVTSCLVSLEHQTNRTNSTPSQTLGNNQTSTRHLPDMNSLQGNLAHADNLLDYNIKCCSSSPDFGPIRSENVGGREQRVFMRMCMHACALYAFVCG